MPKLRQVGARSIEKIQLFDRQVLSRRRRNVVTDRRIRFGTLRRVPTEVDAHRSWSCEPVTEHHLTKAEP